jgi:hypothetical protein
MHYPILAPAAVLVVWSLVMLLWLVVARLGGLKAAGIDLRNAKPGGRGGELNGVLPDKANWKAHNYDHLMEQPTLFYAVIAILAISGAGTALNVQLAWAYTILRIAHSLWQATVNTIMPVRFGLFFVSSVCLIILAINALMAVI